jgi:hypothetical protein
MFKKLTLYLYLFPLLATSQLFGQTASSCTQTLRLAQSTYENGRLHELFDICRACLNGEVADGEFNTEERRQAYKLLVQSYIYLEEPSKADSAMLNLLSTDPFFKPNTDVDPAEFVSLYNRFRTKPLFRYGIKFGPVVSAPRALTDYWIGGDGQGTATYSPSYTFSFGGVFEKDFLDSRRLTVAPEAGFAVRGFTETGTVFDPEGGSDGGAETTLTSVIKIRGIELNPLVKWWLAKDPSTRDQKFEPYIIGGPGIHYVLNASFEDGSLNRLDGAGTNTGPAVDITDVFKPFNFSAIGGAGVRIRLGGIFLNGDVRFQYGLSNIVNPETRTNPETAYDYGWVANDMTMNAVIVNFAVELAYFSPKKLIK